MLIYVILLVPSKLRTVDCWLSSLLPKVTIMRVRDVLYVELLNKESKF